MKQILITILTFLSLSNYGQVTNHNLLTSDLESLFCDEEKQQAIKELSEGNIYYVVNLSFGNGLLRNEKEFEQVLSSYNLKLKYYPTSNEIPNDGDCYKAFFDSVIVTKHGQNIFNAIKLKSDSLFVSKRHDKIYDYWEVDKRPFIPKSSDFNNNSAFIDYLNTTLDSASEFQYVSNCIDNSFFIIEYTVDQSGNSLDCKIVKENFINNENEETKIELRQELIRTINAITIWTPGQLFDYNVSVREHGGVAFIWTKKK